MALTSFAGCADKILGVEYEDCWFETRALSPRLTQWLNDTVDGTNVYRDVVVIQWDSQTREEVARLEIRQAFLRDFVVSDFDAADTSFGVLRFALVPASLRNIATGDGPGFSRPTTFNSNNFRRATL